MSWDVVTDRPKTKQRMTTLIGGGYIADYPSARRMFPGKTKRHVRVSVRTYYGIGRHYWVTAHEEDNPIWDGKEKAWRVCWDDLKSHGAIESKPFLSMISAQQWLKSLVKEFPKKTHVIDAPDLSSLYEEDEKKWLGTYKDGD